MEIGNKKRCSQQRGGSLVEFCFTIPVLLLVAGSTVDLSRYMRFLQVTTFVSQETAEQIYRQCSDITIYNPPDLTTRSLRINQAMTESAITSCVQRLQLGAQEILNVSVGRAAISSKVYRWRISQTSPSVACGSITTLGANDVREMHAKADVDCDDGESKDDTKENSVKDSSEQQEARPNESSIIRRNNDEKKYSKAKSKLTDDEKVNLEDDGVKLLPTGIYQTKNTSGAPARLLVAPSSLCRKSRVATVEVAYDFEPIVKFLPNLMIKLNTDGSQRETTAL